MMTKTDFESFCGRFASYLKQRELRMTAQRRNITGLVYAIESPFQVQQVIELSRALPEKERVTAATIQRTLGELVDAQILACEEDGEPRQYHRRAMS